MAIGMTATIVRLAAPRNMRDKFLFAVMPVLMMAYLDGLKSVTQKAPEGIPVVTGQAKGVYIKLARLIKRWGLAFNVKESDLTYAAAFESKVQVEGEPRPDKNALKGSKYTHWSSNLNDFGFNRFAKTIKLTMVTTIPYWEENEQQSKPFKKPQRPTPWNLREQFLFAVRDSFQANSHKIESYIPRDWWVDTDEMLFVTEAHVKPKPYDEDEIYPGPKKSPQGRLFAGDSPYDDDVPF